MVLLDTPSQRGDASALEPIVSVSSLTVEFPTVNGQARALDSVDFSAQPGERVAIVGESGCGKTMLALSILGLVPEPGLVRAGHVRLVGDDVTGLTDADMRAYRGKVAAMIFQEPMTALNPVLPVSEQIFESLRLHLGMDAAACQTEGERLLALVGLDQPKRRLNQYPHELSGGMRQRVMIAMALAGRPRLMLADEPTTALDVTIQRQILEVLGLACDETGAALVLITHDLGVVAETCSRVVVMYAGRVVEQCLVDELFSAPGHPYTQGLLTSLPGLTPRGQRLTPIEGAVPTLSNLPSGCHFHPRCPKAFDRCSREVPTLYALPGGRLSRCFLCEQGGQA